MWQSLSQARGRRAASYRQLLVLVLVLASGLMQMEVLAADHTAGFAASSSGAVVVVVAAEQEHNQQLQRAARPGRE